MIPSRVTLVDVGPRDGLQNEKQTVDAAIKIELVHRLQAAGLREIEVTSFVSPKWVPQMADNAAVMAGIERKPGRALFGADPEHEGARRGAVDAARASGPTRSSSSPRRREAFSQKNINCSIAESIERFRPVVAAAHGHGIKVRGAVSCRARLPVPGRGQRRRGRARRPPDEGRSASTTAASPTRSASARRRRVQAAMERALKHYPLAEVSGHFHDTYGQAIGNVYASLEVGIATFDASVAGLGGCPYAKGATGNVATEDVLFLLDGLGIDTGVSLDGVVDAAAFISGVLGRKPVSRVGNAMLAKRIGGLSVRVVSYFSTNARSIT